MSEYMLVRACKQFVHNIVIINDSLNSGHVIHFHYTEGVKSVPKNEAGGQAVPFVDSVGGSSPQKPRR